MFILVNGAQKYTIYPPANVEGTSWDIGFVNPMNGDFMGINSITGTMPINTMEDHKEFMALYAYISQNVNIRSAFGFDKNGVQRLDDLILEPKEFTDIVAKVVDIPKESGFLNRLVPAVSDMFGNVSLKLVNKLIYMSKGQSSDMDNSKTMWNSTIGQNKKIAFGFLRGYNFKKPEAEKKEAKVENNNGQLPQQDNDELDIEKSKKPNYETNISQNPSKNKHKRE